MKKNLLFVMPSLKAGGGEKSLVNLLLQLDYTRYNVDLYLFQPDGLFLEALPKEVNLLRTSRSYKAFSQGLGKSVVHFLGRGEVKLAYSRLLFTVKNRVIRNRSASEQYTWKYQSRSIEPLSKEYDAAIGYLEKSSIYYVVDKVRAHKKIGWIHTNYSNSGMDPLFDGPYFKKLDHVVTVSDECAESLRTHFLEVHNKIKIIRNIVSPPTIWRLSDKEPLDQEILEKGGMKLVTVARLSPEKGIDLAVKACSHLVSKGYPVQWYVLGEGGERGNLEKLIREHGLEDTFHLLGNRENPYPFIKSADLYVQPSRYEGRSIAIDEAKILRKAIVVTNYETAKDQIKDGVNGLLADRSEEGLAATIETLLRDPELRNRLITGLSRESLGTEEEVHKLYELC
ncbi:glycosyltransferase [Paenibacillus aurantius]|uniref:Glycosyltransferase n=1 Tax=Paenibacillus aurantius TaxID=2918900 RepID=A0AA96RGU4_9BACL|nr:glycosyltransferase [Paenibacillus aurantius]WNQ12688.1 glycosyltransferase [Paenibacillus aurantius]